MLALATTVAAASTVAAQGDAHAAVRAKPLVRGSGTYHNVDYGYRVRLPEGVVFERSPAPFPNHGFQVPLAAGDTVWVDASYTDSLTLAGVVRGDPALERGCGVVARQPARLGALPARELVYRCPSGLVERKVLALRGSIVYTVAVSREGGVSPSGAELFAAARAGFATTPR